MKNVLLLVAKNKNKNKLATRSNKLGSRNEVKIRKEMSSFNLSWILCGFTAVHSTDGQSFLSATQTESESERVRESERDRDCNSILFCVCLLLVHKFISLSMLHNVRNLCSYNVYITELFSSTDSSPPRPFWAAHRMATSFISV